MYYLVRFAGNEVFAYREPSLGDTFIVIGDKTLGVDFFANVSINESDIIEEVPRNDVLRWLLKEK